MNLVGGEKVAYQVDPLFQISVPSKLSPKYRIYRMAGVAVGDYSPFWRLFTAEVRAMQSMMRIRRHLTLSTLLLGALFSGCTVRAPVSFLEHNKMTLDEAQNRLQQATKPVDRTITYVQISDILLRHVRTSVPLKDTEALGEWMAQYRDAITAAQQTIMGSGRDAQSYPRGYMELEMVLRQHIRWLGDWKGGLIDDERRPIDETMDTAVAVRQQMLDLLFPVEKRDPR